MHQHETRGLTYAIYDGTSSSKNDYYEPAYEYIKDSLPVA